MAKRGELKHLSTPRKRKKFIGWSYKVKRNKRNFVGSWENHLLRLNTHKRPIVNKYREGKLKRTPVRGVK